jgi:hypothetical protein
MIVPNSWNFLIHFNIISAAWKAGTEENNCEEAQNENVHTHAEA